MEPESYIISPEHQQLFRDYVDQTVGDATSSAAFARFYHRKYQFAIVQEKPVYEQTVDINHVFSNDAASDGRYSFHVECRNEVHSFVVEKRGDRVTLLGTRDGQPGTIHLVYETADFINRIAYIFTEPGRYEKEKSWEYCRTFGFHKPKDIDMPGYTLRKSYVAFA